MGRGWVGVEVGRAMGCCECEYVVCDVDVQGGFPSLASDLLCRPLTHRGVGVCYGLCMRLTEFS